MVNIFVDDIRETPAGFIHFYTVNDCVGYLRRMYKAGISTFYLDLDHDAGDYFDQGGDYINILRYLEDMRRMGHLRHMKIKVHFHSGNVVGLMNMRAIVKANRDWMEEV